MQDSLPNQEFGISSSTLNLQEGSVSPTWTVEFNYGQEDDGSMDIDMMWFVPLIVVSAVYLAILGIANRKKSSE